MTESIDLQDAIVFISDANYEDFGTGFVIHRDTQATYVLTCAHVVNKIRGSVLLVEHIPATIIAKESKDGINLGIDLAILRVEGEGLSEVPLLPYSFSGAGAAGQNVIIPGFQTFSDEHLIRTLYGTLESPVKIRSTSKGTMRTRAWALKITGFYLLQPGYSGSPVVAADGGHVVGIVKVLQGEGREGVVIAAEMLAHIWQPILPSLHMP